MSSHAGSAKLGRVSGWGVAWTVSVLPACSGARGPKCEGQADAVTRLPGLGNQPRRSHSKINGGGTFATEAEIYFSATAEDSASIQNGFA